MRWRHIAKAGFLDTLKDLRPQPLFIDRHELRRGTDALKNMPGSPIAWSFDHKPVTAVEQQPGAKIEPLL
jgi:hypothetical protein